MAAHAVLSLLDAPDAEGPVSPGSTPAGESSDTEPDFDSLLGKGKETATVDASEDAEAPAPPEPPAEPTAERTEAVSLRRLRRDRIAFFLGILLTSSGAFGLVLGSVLHDVFRVPWFGTAYGVFGPLNVTAAALGAALLVPGLIALRFALRGGVTPSTRASEG